MQNYGDQLFGGRRGTITPDLIYMDFVWGGGVGRGVYVTKPQTIDDLNAIFENPLKEIDWNLRLCKKKTKKIKYPKYVCNNI